MINNNQTSDWRKEATYITRYAGSGLINTIVGFIVILSAMALGFSPMVSNVAGYAVGFTLGFVLSKKFVFRSNGHFVAESIRYLIAFVISFLLNLLVLRLALMYLDFNVVASQAIAAVAYTLLMYILTRLFVFSTPRERAIRLVDDIQAQNITNLRISDMKYIINALSWREINSSHNLMFVIVITLGLLNFFFGEIVPAGGGFGWDGVNYANMTRNLDSIISNGQLSNYYAQRILPSAIVRNMLILSGAVFSDINIIRGFELYNLLLLVGACWIWKRLANNFSLSIGGRWIGFSGIFINFSVSKQAFYYPVLTDVTALLLGLLLLLFYVEKKPIALFVTTIIGAFVWPLASIYGAMLVLFLKSDISPDVIEPTIHTSDIRISFIKRAWVVLLTVSIVGLILMKTTLDVSDISKLDYLLGKIVTKVTLFDVNSFELKPLITGLPSVAAALIALSMLAGSGKIFQIVIADLLKPRLTLILLAVASVLIPWGIVRAISNPLLPNANSFGWLILHAFFIPPSGKLLLPFVTLAVFWGPVVLLLLLYWQAFCIVLRKFGPGIMAVVGLTLPLSLVTEPRYITAAWPFMVFGLVLALERSHRRASFKYIFAILTVIYAQFWMKINLAPWPEPDYEWLLEFPKQIYFMHYGYWMSWPSYLIQLPIVILSTLWLRSTMLPVKAVDI